MSMVTECPKCGDTFGWYTKVFASGWLCDNRLYGTGEAYNSGMHDSLTYGKRDPRAYCMQCDKPIGYEVDVVYGKPYVVRTLKECKEIERK